jgi:hypothetical protein
MREWRNGIRARLRSVCPKDMQVQVLSPAQKIGILSSNIDRKLGNHLKLLYNIGYFLGSDARLLQSRTSFLENSSLTICFYLRQRHFLGSTISFDNRD